jgi:UDP-2-acetamido-3-amino-2,3-dideoxy-glucuronate N-acetyltransferase
MPKIFIHPTSVVDQGAVIGRGTKIWHFTHIMPEAVIGENCTIGQNVFIANKVKIGNNVKIQNNVSLYTGVICEDDVFLGPSVVFTNVINPRSHVNRKNEFKQTMIKKGASIGANATIVCGVVLGNFSFVGAGAVLTKDVPDYAVMVGNPARHIGWMSAHGQRLKFDENGYATCTDSGKRYFYNAARVSEA